MKSLVLFVLFAVELFSVEKVSIADEKKQNTKVMCQTSVMQYKRRWEDLSPTPLGYDWVETTKGEWFKGKIKGMFRNELEFDSEEIGLYTFDLDDIKQIKSYHTIEVNIEGATAIPGILHYKDGKYRIIQGDKRYTFDKKKVVSFVAGGTQEQQYWSGKTDISFDLRSGNRKQFDYTVQSSVKRRTAKSRLLLDYIGRISRNNGVETANEHRVNEKFDIYLARYFFWTPLFSEYYTDKFKNIDTQYTAGIGLGYTVVDSKKIEWDISGGPAILRTTYITVPANKEKLVFSPSLELSTRLEYELLKITDLIYKYKMTFTNKESGLYKHHMVLTLQNDLLAWLDLDITAIWDYTSIPEVSLEGRTPLQNDYQLLTGIGIEF
jgi:putative salt-induced outer membrane protein YdiY